MKKTAPSEPGGIFFTAAEIKMKTLRAAVFERQGGQAAESVRFFVIGDSGGVNSEPFTSWNQLMVAEQMGKMGDLYQPDFILVLGDNFYDYGVKNVEDKRFQHTFESVYTAESLQVPWYIVAGNHDHTGNVSAQIAYSKVSKRWKFPELYYYLEFPFNNNTETLGFVMMDTNTFCGKNWDYDFTQPKGPEDKTLADQQWKFVETTLEESRSKYLFTIGHYPVYSVGHHGPTECLVDKLLPLLVKNNASGHMCGHDHNLQVGSETEWNIHYFVSGMAARRDSSSPNVGSVPSDSLKFHTGASFTKGGFLYAEATSSNMTLTFISGRGEHLYSTHVDPRM